MSGMIIFGEDWGGLPSSTQHLAARLSRNSDIVWVNSIGLRRPRLNRRDFGRAAAKLHRMFSRSGKASVPVTPLPQRISTVDPRAISWPGSALAAGFNRRVVGGQVRAALAARRIERPILWASLPSVAPLLGAFGESAVVYYCGDDFGALAGVDHDAAVAMEHALAARADLIFAASEELAGRFDPRKTVLLPHGVDYDLFATPAPRARDLPRGRPVAGFYGSIADWIDVGMLARSARALPDWDFVLIGKVETDVSALAGIGNIRLLGPRPHVALPSYVQHWDVSLLPFRDTPQIRACNPLKLREYLASGRPVATMPFPALAGYLDCVHVSRSPDDFATAILAAVREGDRLSQRRARVATESWDARAALVAQKLAQL